MFKHLIFILVLVLVGCANTTGLEPTERYSGFDNSRIVDIQPHGNACSTITCTGFGLQWNSKYPNSVLMIVQVFNDITAILDAQLNIDGEVVTLDESQLFSDFETMGYIQNSSKAFILPLDTLENIATADRVWMRVRTPSGTIEDAIIDGQKDSKSYHALKRFLAKLHN